METRQEIENRLGPAPTTPLEALRHTLRAHNETSAGDMAVEATAGVYGILPDDPHRRTGLTHGDLRQLETEIRADERERLVSGPIGDIEPSKLAHWTRKAVQSARREVYEALVEHYAPIDPPVNVGIVFREQFGLPEAVPQMGDRT